MILCACFYIDKTEWFEEQFLYSRHLYNQGRYVINNHYKEHKNFISQTELNRILRNYEPEFNNYRNLCKAKLSQMILIHLCNNYKSYFKSVKDYKVNPSKYKGEPRLPKYKDTLNPLYFDYQSVKIRDGFIVITKDVKVHIPTNVYRDEFKSFKTVNFIPKGRKIKVVISYETAEIRSDLDADKYLSIDFGMNNLCACISEDGCFLINGRPLKSINQIYNKKSSEFKERRPKIDKKYQDKRVNRIKLESLSLNRELRINSYLHNCTTYIVNFCIEHKIGTIVLGRNKNWKDSISLSKTVNQNFVGIPFYKLMNMLAYKCKRLGINFVLQEEAYTSKCDALAFESIEKHESYKGSRIKRGLFKSSVGKLINADINGALNILRKFLNSSKGTSEFSVLQKIIGSGLVFRPVRITGNGIEAKL